MNLCFLCEAVNLLVHCAVAGWSGWSTMFKMCQCPSMQFVRVNLCLRPAFYWNGACSTWMCQPLIRTLCFYAKKFHACHSFLILMQVLVSEQISYTSWSIRCLFTPSAWPGISFSFHMYLTKYLHSADLGISIRVPNRQGILP